MDRIIDLQAIVQREVEDYASGGSWQTTFYPISDTTRQHYTVLAFPDYPRKFRAGIVIAARIINDKVVIDEDITDRPLVEELLRAGIPREQIVLAYAGEPVPTTEDPNA